MVKFLSGFELMNTTLLVLPGRDETVMRAAGNIPKLQTLYVNTLNVYDILKAGKIILTQEALKGVEEVYA
jgi:large subunit ribosomal protein L4